MKIVVALTLAGAAVFWIRRELRRAAARRDRERRRATVAQFAAEVAAELRAGTRPAQAVARAVRPAAGLEWAGAVAAAAADGGDVAGTLRAAAWQPGAADLRALATCWQVCERSGASLATGFEAVAQVIAERERFRVRLAAQLAGIRVGGWLLGGLPVLAMLLGTAVGGSPVSVLFGTRVGAVLLCLGLGLDLAGVCWLRRMTASTEAVA
jgi:tight adherence protein B